MEASMARDPKDTSPRPADVLVIFGITGDLAKVMTFRSLYRLEARGLLDCPIVGVAVDDWSHDDLAQHARAAIVATGEKIEIRGAATPVFYLEIPPFLFGGVAKGLAGAGLIRSGRVVVEKPFGHDLESARALADEIHQYVDESQLYRIDHFLGKMGLEEYEVLLQAATAGNSTRFTRQDGVEETWRIMQPLLDAPSPVQTYAPGSWGPAAADLLPAGSGGWRGPWMAS
jgi:glucose-6-phosphate 1-dehydrogenase